MKHLTDAELLDTLDGNLAADDHIAQCDICKMKLRWLARGDALLDSTQDTDAVDQSLAAGMEFHRPRFPQRRKWLSMAVAASVVAIITFITLNQKNADLAQSVQTPDLDQDKRLAEASIRASHMGPILLVKAQLVDIDFQLETETDVLEIEKLFRLRSALNQQLNEIISDPKTMPFEA